jgi:hypothetical protein
MQRCTGTLSPYPSAQLSYDAVTGLDHLACGTCCHHGMRAQNGLHLVFRGSHKYVLYYPPSFASVTVKVSASLLGPFTWHGLTPSQAVICMGEWLLLTGRVSGIVDFAEERMAWEDCYDYVRRDLLRMVSRQEGSRT